MRLWHKDLISVLPRKQLQGQWRELLAIKGAICKNGTPNHVLVNKLLDYSINEFKQYSKLIYDEGIKRGINFKESKMKEILNWGSEPFRKPQSLFEGWHNDRYLIQCVYNLQEKYDCGAMTQKEWELIEDKFYKINKNKSINDVWNEFIDLLGKECLKKGVK